jgi:hypothetical protein
MSSPAQSDLLSRAARAMRDEADGDGTGGSDAPDTIESWQAMDDWREVSRDVRRNARRRRMGLLLALQLLVGLVGVGAWAAASGRLPPIFSRWMPAPRQAAAPVSPARAHTARARREPAVLPAAPVAVDPTVAPAPAPEPAARLAAVSRPSVTVPPHAVPPPQAVPAPPAPPVVADADEIYARAHRAQFALRDYTAALALWDAYLATPGGTLGLEARWNRAIALIHVGRREAAVAALAPFAAGENEGYRQEEAQSLLRLLEGAPR